MRNLDSTIYGENSVVLYWYDIIAFIALGIALLGAFWIFYDSQRKNVEPLSWKVLIVISIVFLVPSVAVAVDERIAQNVSEVVPLLAYFGMAAMIASLISILGYLAKVGYDAFDSFSANPDQYEYDSFPTTDVDQPLPPNLRTQFPTEQQGFTAQNPTAFGGPQPDPVTAPPPTAGTVGRHPPTEAFGSSAPFSGGNAVNPAKPPKTELLQTTPDEMAYLVLRSGPRAGKDYRLGNIVTIGRDAQQCDILLDDSATSSQHARIKLENGRFILHDLASTNGTKVNNANITRHPLEDGDQITIGKTRFAFMQINAQKSTG